MKLNWNGLWILTGVFLFQPSLSAKETPAFKDVVLKKSKATGPSLSISVDGVAVSLSAPFNFGQLKQETSTHLVKKLTVKNTGRVLVVSSGPQILGTGFKLIKKVGFLELKPGASKTFNLEIDTSTVGDLNAKLVLRIVAPGSSELNLALQAQIIQAHQVKSPILTPNLEAGLIAHFSFEGNTSDSTGNGNHLVSFRAPVFTSFAGDQNHALYFDGEAARFWIPELMNFFGTNQFTISFWIKKENPGVDAPLFTLGGRAASMLTDGDTGLYEYQNSTAGSSSVKQATLGYLGPDWHHLVVSYDGQQASIYVDGVSVAQTSQSGLFNTDHKFVLGAFNDISSSILLKGSIDELMIYSRALDASTVMQLRNADAVVFAADPAISPKLEAFDVTANTQVQANRSSNLIYLGATQVGTELRRAHLFRLKNTGAAPLHIRSITNTLQNTYPDIKVLFDADSKLSALPASLDVGEEATFWIALEPTIHSLHTGYIEVKSDDPSNSSFMINVFGAVGGPTGPICAGDNNNYRDAGFSCIGRPAGTICGESNGLTKVCNQDQCVLIGDANNDGLVNAADYDEFMNKMRSGTTSRALDFTCSGYYTSKTEDLLGFADLLFASIDPRLYNSCVRNLCSHTDQNVPGRGRALVFMSGPIDWTNYQYKNPVEACVDNLGAYDPETGEKIPDPVGVSGYLNGKFLRTEPYPLPGNPPFGDVAPIYSSTNDFFVPYAGDASYPQREAIMWSSEAQIYHDINDYRSRFFNDKFIKALKLPPEIEINLRNRQFRPDLSMGEDPVLLKPEIRPFENINLYGVGLFPIGNAVNVGLRSRANWVNNNTPPVNMASLPPISNAFDTEFMVGDYAGLMAFWILGTNLGFPSEAFFGQNSAWQSNILPALNDGLSSWVAYRYSGNTEVYKYYEYTHRMWNNRPCGGTRIPCDKGQNIRNVMMFDEAITNKDGVFPFSWPNTVQPPADGPSSSDLAGLFFGAVFYDIANEAGLGLYNTDLLAWKTISLITDRTTFPMRAFGAKVLEAALALWPDSRPGRAGKSLYEEDIADVLTSRGIPLYGKTNFRDNLPNALSPVLKVDARNFGSAHPNQQNGANFYGIYSANSNGYTYGGGINSYTAYQFYKHSKLGPCDEFQFTDGTFDPTNGAYNNDGSFFWALRDQEPIVNNSGVVVGKKLTDRDLGNLILFTPGNTIRWRNYRKRCDNEARGYYVEDTQAFGFRAIKAIPNGFSIRTRAIEGNRYQISVVDPSVEMGSFLPPVYNWKVSAAVDWKISDTPTYELTGSGTSITIPKLVDQPIVIHVDRIRDGKTDAIEVRERSNDLDRDGGTALVKTCLLGITCVSPN